MIEGAHVRVGLASDIELYDEFPQDYLSYARRQHRWIRGDWQIADWILPRVPSARRTSGAKPALLVRPLEGLRQPAPEPDTPDQPGIAYSLLVDFSSDRVDRKPARRPAVVLPRLGAAHHGGDSPAGASRASPSQGWRTTCCGRLSKPHCFRTRPGSLSMPFCVSGIAASSLIGDCLNGLRPNRCIAMLPNECGRFVLLLCLASILSVIVGCAVWYWMPSNLWAAVPWLVLWCLSPLIGWILTLRPQAKPQQLLLSQKDLQFLREVARRTWRYFSDFVGDKTSWLPPDNYQVSHKNQVAMRTSPTNIGFWMLSTLAAHDFGYLTVDQVVATLTRTGDDDRHAGAL